MKTLYLLGLGPLVSSLWFVVGVSAVNRGPVVNQSTHVLTYIYQSPQSRWYKNLKNQWTPLVPALKINDTNSFKMYEAYIIFDPATYDGDLLRYDSQISDIIGFFDPDRGTMAFEGTASKDAWERALQSVRYKAADKYAVYDNPNEFVKYANITVVDKFSAHGEAFEVQIRLKSAHTVLREKASVTIVL